MPNGVHHISLNAYDSNLSIIPNHFVHNSFSLELFDGLLIHGFSVCCSSLFELFSFFGFLMNRKQQSMKRVMMGSFAQLETLPGALRWSCFNLKILFRDLWSLFYFRFWFMLIFTSLSTRYNYAYSYLQSFDLQRQFSNLQRN